MRTRLYEQNGYANLFHYISQRPTDHTIGQGVIAYRSVATARKKGPVGVRGADALLRWFESMDV
jgi:hypothetical protein